MFRNAQTVNVERSSGFISSFIVVRAELRNGDTWVLEVIRRDNNQYDVLVFNAAQIGVSVFVGS